MLFFLSPLRYDNMIIREVENPKLRDLFNFTKNRNKNEISQLLEKVKIVGSGKGAIELALGYLSKKGVIKNKLDEILAPDWLGSWVYQQMHAFSFPAKRFSNRTKIIFVYHQYGFPQDMDKIMEFARSKKLIVIEDCAHALASDYKGKPVGSFGDFSLYSFSKWFFCYALGGVKSTFKDFGDYADKNIKQTPTGLTFLKDTAKLLYEYGNYSQWKFFQNYSRLFLAMTYSLYGEALKPGRLAINSCFSKIKDEINIRRSRYRYFMDQTSRLGICDHLESEGITPYVIPIICPEAKNRILLNKLSENKVVSGLYHFDVNRNLLSPKFVQCLWIPCHGGISEEKFRNITDIVIKTL